MANEFSRIEANDDNRSLTELELLEALLADDVTYPWNPNDLESEEYFVEQSRQFPLEDWSDSEITTRSNAFFSKIELLWSETVPELQPTDIDNLQTKLQQRAAYIPERWLSAIASKAYHVLAEQKLIADKIVQCVQELLPNWAEDDLLVLARPFAYTMRGVDTIPNPQEIESVLGNASSLEWSALSEFEQARAGLAIARYALAQLEQEKLDRD